jgi:hypothetical protein
MGVINDSRDYGHETESMMSKRFGNISIKGSEGNIYNRAHLLSPKLQYRIG